MFINFAENMTSSVSYPFRRDCGILLILLLFSFVLIMVGSRDGWLRMPTGTIDTIWYQMAGKAWMEGLVPYQDFSDSKGPLLWLIYGIGYLLTPHSFHGVALIEILFYWLNFYVLYRTGLLLMKDSPKALLAAMCMAIFYFFPGVHGEVLTEDYCHLFNSIILYILVQGLCRNRFRKKYALWLGVCSGCTLLIKYSYFLTTGVPILLLFIFIVRRGGGAVRFLAGYMAGFCLTVLPFVIYFLAVGAFGNFVTEYFVNTGSSILVGKEVVEEHYGDVKHRWPLNIWYLYRPLYHLPEYMRYGLLALVVTIFKFRDYRRFLLTLIVWYAASVILFAVLNQGRYFLSLGVFIFPGIAALFSPIKRMKTDGAVISGACVLALLTILNSYFPFGEFYYIKQDYVHNVMKQDIADIINRRERETGHPPTITFYYCGDLGETLATNALPGTKYWSQQFGMTEEMLKEYGESIFRERPDFVVIDSIETDPDAHRKLEAGGYELVTKYNDVPAIPGIEPNPRYLYVRRDP